MPRVDVELPQFGITGWVEFRPMTIDDLEVMGDSDKDPSSVVRRLKDAAESYEFSNGKPLGEQPREMFRMLLRGWNKREDEDALPPVNGQPSNEPS